MRLPAKVPSIRNMRPPRTGVLIALAILLTIFGVAFIATSFIESEADVRAAKMLDAALINAPPELNLSYSRVDISLWRQSVSLVGVQFKNLTIDRVRIGGVDWESLSRMIQTRKPVIPRELTVELSGIHLSQDLLGEQGAATLQLLGYNEIVASMSVSLAFDRVTKNLDIKNFELASPHVGRLEAKASITDFILPTPEEIARFKKDPRLLLTDTSELTKAALKSLEVTYIDDSFFKRVTTALVQSGEDSPESLVELAIEVNEPSPRTIASSPNPARVNDFTKPALQTLLKFVRKPSMITLISNPPKPIPFVSMLDEKTSGSINDLGHQLYLTVR